MAKFIKSKDSSECMKFYNDKKMKVLSIEDWLEEEKELMGTDEYNQIKKSYIG